MSSGIPFFSLENGNSMTLPDHDVSLYLDELATRLKNSGEKMQAADSEDYWKLIERVLAYAASAEQHISEQQIRILELEGLSTTDELTGLPNRRRLKEFLGRTLSSAKRYDETGVLAFIDMNNFKRVNDTYGHNAGDELLRHMAKILVRSLRSTDFVARVGGDEFVIVLVRASAEEGIKRARTIQQMLTQEFITKRNEKIFLSASFGITKFDGDNTIPELLRKSDLRMYEDKKRHRTSA